MTRMHRVGVPALGLALVLAHAQGVTGVSRGTSAQQRDATKAAANSARQLTPVDVLPLRPSLLASTQKGVERVLETGMHLTHEGDVSAPASAHTATATSLQGLNSAIAELTAKVAPSVVQVLVTGFRMVDAGDGGGVVMGRARGSGSGAVVDADGYIITNAHVVEGAERVRVILHVPAAGATPLKAMASDRGRAVSAQVVGVAKDVDLALLKIDRKGLTPLPMADYDSVRQGELVFAFGSPEGLRDSVSMGVVSTTARQLEPDSVSVYVQTDAPINPGNSGGPLVNIRGELVGLNAFRLSQSGGSQGLGFAIPSAVVAATYHQIRTYGHPNR